MSTQPDRSQRPVRFVASLLLALATAACALGGTTGTPSYSPIAAATASRPAPTAQQPSPAATSTATLVPPTPTATLVPTATPVPPVALVQYPAGTLVHPLAAAVVSNTLYIIDSGTLKSVDLGSPAALRKIAPPDGIVDKHPIQDLTALAYSAPAKALFLLDRSGAIYGWDLAARWWLEREAGGESNYAQEYPVDLVADGQDVYLIDTNNGRLFRRAEPDWKPVLTSGQLDGAIRMASSGGLFILVGERPKEAARLLRLRGGALSEVKVSGGMEQPSLLSPGPSGSLILVDRGFTRIRQIDTAAGTADQILAADGVDTLALSLGSSPALLLGADWLITVRGDLPGQLGLRPAAARPIQPNGLAALAAVPPLRMPIPGAKLPDIDRSLPGAPRPYRFGIHEGIDLYSSTTGVSINLGTPVRAAAGGVVLRADNAYKEASAAQNDEWLNECFQLRMTPPAIQDHLGGRQVWLDHGNGVGTRYLHLSKIAQGLDAGSTVKAGDIIGYAGNSGTPEAAAGSSADVHLHFEVRLGNGYLGQWLGPIETRRWLATLLSSQ